MFRQDRIGPIGGAVLILVKNDIIAFEQKQFQTDCEIVWIKVVLIGSTPLYSRTSMAWTFNPWDHEDMFDAGVVRANEF